MRRTSINMLAMSVITYSFNIIDWNLSEWKRLDIKVRKLMTVHSINQPKANIRRLFLQRSNEGKGFTQLKLSCKTSTIGLLPTWIYALTGCYEALKHGKGKFLHSVVKEAREFAREMELDLETEFDREMKNTENALKLARIAKENGKKAIDTAWKSKSLHSKYPLQSRKSWCRFKSHPSVA